MARVEGDLLFAPVARVGGHHLGADQQVHLFDPADGGHLVVGVVGRHRVVVAVEAHETERVRPGLGDPSGLEGLGRQGEHGRPVDGEALGLGLGLAPHPAEQVGEAGGRQVVVQRRPRGERRDRDQQVPPRVADVVLDMALLVAPTDLAEVLFEEMVALRAAGTPGSAHGLGR